MTLSMNEYQNVTFEQLQAFVEATHGMNFSGDTRREKYAWIEKIATRFWYRHARKKNKTRIKKFAIKITGYSDSQMTRLLSEFCRTKHIRVPDHGKRSRFKTIYTKEDIARLLETDNAHSRMSGDATIEIFNRQYNLFHDIRYSRLQNISVSHLYNLRGTRQYVSQAMTHTKTNPTTVPIGVRRKPFSDGKPGYIRVDSVHQGDLDRVKGVYHVNLVDEVTQWEIICCVEGISESFLLPALYDALSQFPFHIVAFHSDNGSEYINKQVAAMLNKMVIDQTKSRPRHSNDNALAESKNGSVIRKHMGHIHIPQKFAPRINYFYQMHLNNYVNFHRPSGYATDKIDARGKIRKVYDTYETPYEHFKGLKNVEQYLKIGNTFSELDKIAYVKSDNDYAILMQEAKYLLFKSFHT